MQPVIDEYVPEIEIAGVHLPCAELPADQPEQIRETREVSNSAPPYAALMMPASRAALMAVLDENGYLLPVFTAADLLRGCKYLWSASRD